MENVCLVFAVNCLTEVMNESEWPEMEFLDMNLIKD